MFTGACREITYRGQQAFLFVLRYECNDDVALSAFARAVTRGRVEQAAGWLGLFSENERLLPSTRR